MRPYVEAVHGVATHSAPRGRRRHKSSGAARRKRRKQLTSSILPYNIGTAANTITKKKAGKTPVRTVGTTKQENDIMHQRKKTLSFVALQEASARSRLRLNITLENLAIPVFQQKILLGLISEVTHHPDYSITAVTFHCAVAASEPDSISSTLPKPTLRFDIHKGDLTERGGFTLTEIFHLQKQRATMKAASYYNPIPPAKPNELVVLLDRQFNPVLFVVGESLLDDEDVAASLENHLDYMKGQNKIWYSNCQLSMSGTYGKTKLLLEHCQEAREAVCADLVPLAIAAKKGTASVVIQYKNKAGSIESYNCGGFMYRDLQLWSQLAKLSNHRVDAMASHVVGLMGMLDPFAKPASIKEEQLRSKSRLWDMYPDQNMGDLLTIAGNKTIPNRLIGTGGHGQHSDKETHGLAAVVADTITPGMLLSEQKFGGSKGALLFEIGMALIPYNKGDVVLFDGRYFHAPLYPAPAVESQKKPATRVSMVFFRNQKRMDADTSQVKSFKK